MKLLHLRSGPLHVNTYFLLNDAGNRAVVIDGGENYKLVKETEEKYGFRISAVFLTHAHFDHAGNAAKLQKDGAKIYISATDAPKLLNGDNLSGDFGRKFEYLKADVLMSDGDEFDLDGIKIKAIATPGHTDGSMCFICGRCLFTGDTLFHLSVGRTDFVSGSRADIVKSVKKLFDLKGDYDVFPGHDEFTSLNYERENNVFADYD